MWRRRTVGGQRIVVRFSPKHARGPDPLSAHPSDAELTDFALGSLDEHRSTTVESHIYHCRRCSKFVARVPGDEFIRELQNSGLPFSNGANHSAHGDGHLSNGFLAGHFSIGTVPSELRDHPRFEIKRLIAEGAMGRVYLAIDRYKETRVALKVLQPAFANDPLRIARFRQECEVASELQHDNVARVTHCECAGRSMILVLEYVEGHTLAQIVRSRGPLPVDEACDYICQTAAGLAGAARRGIVHRDIKPQNIMLESQTQLIKIVDFGLGRFVEERRSGFQLTAHDEILGTLDFMSPEQAASSRDADIRSDIYSLGCTLYYLLAGAPPFRGESISELLRKHESERPIPIRVLRPEVPIAVASALDRMMEKDPKHRPQTPLDVLKSLAQSPPSTPNWSRIDPLSTPVSSKLKFIAPSIFRWLGSPAVWLPVLTSLLCVMWLLLD
jgi:eukaryotic-like serine/threonine-protein kinase